MSTITDTLYTPDDLLAMPDGDQYELVDGRLVERKEMGARAAYVGSQLMLLIGNHNRERKLGRIFTSDAGYQAFPNNRVRKPDLSFVRRGRLPGERVPEGNIKVAPDLAVEVISPTDIHYETDRKVEEYLQAGTRLVWVVNPEVRTILVYRLDGSIIGLREKDTLDGEDVLPGFRCSVSDLFESLDDVASD